MKLTDMENAIEEAETILRRADMTASKMARLLTGRLRKVNTWILKDLKRELKDFNAHTGEWK